MKTLIIACFGVLAFPVMAQENLPNEALSVEVEYPRSAANTAFGFGALWIANGFQALRLDTATGQVTQINLDGASQKQRKIAIGEGAVWIPDVGADTIFKIDPVGNSVVGAFPIGMLSTQGSVGVGAGSIWVVSADGFEKTLVRLDAETGNQQAKIALPNSGVGVAVGFNSVWVTSGMGDALYRIDANDNTVSATLEVGDGPMFVTTSDDSVWVHIQSDASVIRVDGETGEIAAMIETGLPSGAADIEVGGGYLWMNTPYKVSLAQIDPGTNTLLRTFSGNQGADAVEYGDGALWISGRSIKRVTPPK